MSSSLLLVVVTCFLLTTQPYLLNANKLRYLAEMCRVNGHITGKSPPKSCNTENDSECCVDGKRYNTYTCSPPVTRTTQAKMTLNSFMKGADGGGKPACGGYYDDDKLVVALSTGWFNHTSRCNKMVRIFANGRSVLAKVVDECDSRMGCDEDHAYQPPCGNNVVDASRAVWKKLGYTEDEDQWGEAKVTWSDA